MIKELLKSSGLAALAAALAVTALPATSFARDNDGPRWQRGGGDRGSPRSESPRAERSSPSPRAPRSESSSPAPSPRVERSAPAARADYQPPRQVSVPASRIETRAVGGGDSRPGRSGGWGERRADVQRGGSRGDGRARDGRAGWQPPQPAQASAAPVASGRDTSYGAARSRAVLGRDGRGRDGDRGGDSSWRGRDGDGDRGRDGNRGGDGSWRGRDGDRDGRGRDGNWRDNNGNRDGNWRGRDGDRDWRGRDGDRDHRRWNRGWRDNNRYNWRHYRDRNRTVFHLGLYYAPYRNYSYSRIGVGFYLDSLFFGSRYWINDPWLYRLPEVYGPYRWVRYYDDVVLVDIYTGEVVDVIYDFFW
jgi:hypothetical protein